jgi:formate/nitrite transporter
MRTTAQPPRQYEVVMFSFDAYTPKEIAAKVAAVGVAKAHLPALQTAMLGVVAGGFIGLGALYYTVVISDAQLSFGVARVLGGITFSLGLILVVIAGAELFTGNNLLVMAWADRKITLAELLRNWLLVYIANAVGAIGLAVLVYLSHHADMNHGAIGLAYLKIAAAKTTLPFAEAFFKGVLCNLLVCLAVWLALAGHSVTDKAIAIVLPVSAFVAAGFEHCVANMYFIPLGIFLRDGGLAADGINAAALTWGGFLGNLVPVTLGNIVGGSGMVALVYYTIYHRQNGA